MKKQQFIMAIILFALLVVSRLVPHPHNFTALSGVALFAGALWRGKSLRFVVPLLAVFMTDMYFGFYSGMEWTYLGIAVSVLLAPQLKSSLVQVGFRAVLASFAFFTFSNLGVWMTSGMYTFDMAGLSRCFLLAIPFFHNTLLSSLFYSAVLFSLYRLAFYEKGFKGFTQVRPLFSERF